MLEPSFSDSDTVRVGGDSPLILDPVGGTSRVYRFYVTNSTSKSYTVHGNIGRVVQTARLYLPVF